MAEQALTVINSRYEMTPAEQHAAYLEEKRSLIISMCIPQEFHDKTAIIDTYFELSRLRRLNPITKEINCIKRANKPSFETSLAGYRLIASRTGVYAGSDEYVHLGNEDGHPVVSACTVWKFVNGERCPFTASVRWEEFAAYRDGKPSNNWASMPFHMLGKTAETHALRKAFPEETSGLYTSEEMEQSDNVPSGPPREVRQAGKPIAQPARIAPLSAPRTKATAQPNGAEEQRRRFAEAAQVRGLPIHEDMSSDDMAAIIDVALHAAGLGFRVARTEEGIVTGRALHNALMAIPPRVVDQETGEVQEQPIEGEAREEEMSDADRALYTATDQGNLLTAE